jgi:hypothetical protein
MKLARAKSAQAAVAADVAVTAAIVAVAADAAATAIGTNSEWAQTNNRMG